MPSADSLLYKGKDWFTLAAMTCSWRMQSAGSPHKGMRSGSNVNAHGRPSTRSVLKTLLPQAYEHLNGTIAGIKRSFSQRLSAACGADPAMHAYIDAPTL